MNSKIENHIILILVSLSIFNCEPSGKKPSDMSPQELVKSREIKKISDIDILEFAEKKGKALMTLIDNKILLLPKNNTLDSVNFFSVYSAIKNDSAFLDYEVNLRLISAYISNKEGQPDLVEAQIIEAYNYNLENNLPVSESIQLLEDKTHVLFTKPIVINNRLAGMWSLKLSKKEIIANMD